LVAASGLRRQKQVVPHERTRDGYLEEAKGMIERAEGKWGVVLIGGGRLIFWLLSIISPYFLFKISIHVKLLFALIL
jgi:hypothetical protein